MCRLEQAGCNSLNFVVVISNFLSPLTHIYRLLFAIWHFLHFFGFLIFFVICFLVFAFLRCESTCTAIALIGVLSFPIYSRVALAAYGCRLKYWFSFSFVSISFFTVSLGD